MSPNPSPAYQAPAQSPHWSSDLSLEYLLKSAKFFILRKQHPGGHLVDVVLGIRRPRARRKSTAYDFKSLGYNASGVTCAADGTLLADSLAAAVSAGTAKLTMHRDQALRHLWEAVNSRTYVNEPFAQS